MISHHYKIMGSCIAKPALKNASTQTDPPYMQTQLMSRNNSMTSFSQHQKRPPSAANLASTVALAISMCERMSGSDSLSPKQRIITQSNPCTP